MSPREEDEEDNKSGELSPSLGEKKLNGNGKHENGASNTAETGLLEEEASYQPTEVESGEEKHSAPDGGWGWVIVLECFMVHMVVDGITYTFGIILAEMVRSFQTGRSETSWVGSVQTVLMLLLGFLSGSLVESFGARPAVTLGILASAIGFVASAWAPNITVLYITYGVIPGIGFSFVFVGSVVAVQNYFHKRRAMATGIAVAGTGAGVFAMAPLIQYLIEKYTWRGALLLEGGFLLNLIPFAMLLRPLPKPKKETPETVSNGVEKINQHKKPMQEVKEKIIESLDFRVLLKDAYFMLFMTAAFISYCGHMVPFFYLPDRALTMGIDPFRASFLISIIGISNTVSRLVCGAIADRSFVNRPYVFSAAVMIAGIDSLFSPFGHQYWAMCIYATVFGACAGTYVTLYPPTLVDLFGTKNIAKTYGMGITAVGFSTLAAVPIAGKLYDVFLSYDIPFYVMGSLEFVGGALYLVVPFLQKLKARNKCTARKEDIEFVENLNIDEKPVNGHAEGPNGGHETVA